MKHPPTIRLSSRLIRASKTRGRTDFSARTHGVQNLNQPEERHSPLGRAGKFGIQRKSCRSYQRTIATYAMILVAWLASMAGAQAGTWSQSTWTDDATTGITSANTLWAYHFGSTVNATVNGVNVTGSMGGVYTSQAEISYGQGAPYQNATNNLTAAGGNGSAVMASGFIYTSGGPMYVTLKSLAIGQKYVVSFFGVGFDPSGPRTVNFSSGADSMLVNQNAYGQGNGIRVDYVFTAAASTQSFNLMETVLNYSWGLNAVVLSNSPVYAPTVATPGVTSITRTSAMFGAEVTSDGGAAITQRGVVYARTDYEPNPTRNTSGTSAIFAGGTTGAFTVPTTTLQPNTSYSYRGYATNSAGTGYTSVSTFTTAANQTPVVAVTVLQPAAFSNSGMLLTARQTHTESVLADGKVLIAGGAGSGTFLNSAEIYDPATNAWSSAGSMTTARQLHTSSVLQDGRVLVVGGEASSGANLTSAELYDPTTNTWSSAGALSNGRNTHTATVLNNGKVLVTGGFGDTGRLASSELYDPETNTWSAAASLAKGRSHHAASLLTDGKVLVMGGFNGGALSSAELYNPATNTWSAAGSLIAGRSSHQAVRLTDGRVLIAGGGNGGALASTELYDPATNAWSVTGSLATARSSHSMNMLADGKVLVAGGQAGAAAFSSAELYNPATGSWSSAGNLSTARYNFTGSVLASGKVLLAGGTGTAFYLQSAELFSPDLVDVSAPEGSPAPHTGTFADADGNATVVLTASSGSISKNNAAGTWSWSKTGTDGPTNETVIITATDDFDATATASFVLKITNVAPSFELGDDESLPEGTGALNRAVAFSDPGADTWSGTVNYGDGSGNQPLSLNPNAKTFALSHFYEVGGSYTVSVTLTDDDGGTHSDSYAVSCSRIVPVSGWSYAAWTGDSTSGIAAPETLWAYHFGSTTTATLNGVTIPGSFYGIVSDAQVDLWSTSVYGGAVNSLTVPGGNGSALIAGSFAYNGIGGATTLTLKNLTPGQVYTLSFFGVGFDTSAPRNVNFTSGTDSLVVNQNHFGYANGIRVSYTFTASDPWQSFSLLETAPFYSWGLNAIALRSGAPGTPSVLALSTPVLNVNQGATSATVTVTRSQGSKPVSVTLATADGTAGTVPPFTAALAGTDYTAQTTVVNFAEGEMSKDVTLTLAPKAGTTIPNKRFAVSLSSPSEGAELGDVSSTEVRILANDMLKPGLIVTAPAATATTLSTASPYQVKGIAGDARGIDRVEVVLNGGVPVNAILGSATLNTSRPYSLDIEPVAGPNTLAVTAFDLRGNSTTVTRTFTHTRRYLITLGRNAPVGTLLDAAGTVSLAATPVANASAQAPATANANPRISAVIPGTLMKLTATPKPGHVFSHWDGVPAGALLAGNVISFTMPAGDLPVITATFVPNPFTFPSGMGGVFYGLIHPETGTTSGNASEGWFTGTLTTTSGLFSGRILIDGVTQSFSATFQGDGSTWFNIGKARLTELSFGGRTLTLAFSGGEITATVVHASGTSTGTARRAHYSSTRKVPAGLLNQKSNTKQTVNNQGLFTVAMPAKTQPGARDASTYPQGDGFGTVMLTELGMLTYAGTLADGSTFTASSGLISGNVSPVFAQLVTPGAASTVKGGSLGGTLAFDGTASDSDVTATNLLWIRPAVTETPGITLAQKATQLYTAGWPEGIHLDAVGALYDRTMDVQTALDLGPVNPADGNGELLLSLGKLTSGISVTKFNLAPGTMAGTSIATKIPVTNPAFTLVTTQNTGAFGGTFTPNWSSPERFKPTFKGILLQKGGSKGGYGFFISNRAVDLDPESGRVTLGAQNR